MKIILLTIICMMLTNSCAEREKTPENFYVKKLSYSGHSYISFRTGNYTSGIVHDPNCQCNKISNIEK